VVCPGACQVVFPVGRCAGDVVSPIRIFVPTMRNGLRYHASCFTPAIIRWRAGLFAREIPGRSRLDISIQRMPHNESGSRNFFLGRPFHRSNLRESDLWPAVDSAFSISG
jgi:hypothetical protein